MVVAARMIASFFMAVVLDVSSPAGYGASLVRST
jgi:hypothetical protein